jgi:hypothetical protein
VTVVSEFFRVQFVGSCDRACLSLKVLVLLLCLTQSLVAAGDERSVYLGRPVAQVVNEFRSAGYPFAYSTNLLPEDLTVSTEPRATEPLQIVREILAPYHLTVKEEQGFLLIVRADPRGSGAGTLLLIVRDDEDWRFINDARVSSEPQLPEAALLGSGVYQYQNLETREYRILIEADGFETGSRTVKIRAGKPTVIEVELRPAREAIEMITVSSSRYDIWSDLSTSPFFMSRLSIQNLPDIGDDPLRAVQTLPGTASTGVSARTYVRGGDYSETAVYLNGNKLLDPFHARDFQNLFSTVDSRIIDGVEVYTGGLPVRYGDQMSGAILLNTIDPSIVQRNELGISVYNTSAMMSGALASGRGGWLASARRGNLDLVIKPDNGAPRYYDMFGSFHYALAPNATLTANALYAKDEITVILANKADEVEIGSSDTRNFQFWMQLENQWSDDLQSTSFISMNSYDNTRIGDIDDPEKYVSRVNDQREFREYLLRQDWEWGYSDRHILQWGVELGSARADYAYFSDTSYFGLPLLYSATPTNRVRELRAAPEGSTYSLYVGDKWQFAKRTFAEYGLRYDRQTYDTRTFSAQVSPRLNLFHATRGGTELRASWGRFFQSQDLRELQIEDGISDFYSAQRSDQIVVGVRQPFGEKYALRVELYQKDYARLRPRYETLFSPLALIPEIVADRVRIAPTSARARGVELMLDRVTDGPLSWWIAYSYSEATDRIGGADIPRSWDQRKALRGGLNWSTDRWDLGVAATLHDGWPTTSLAIMQTAGQNAAPVYQAQPGRRNAENFAMFASLDARVNRKFRFGDHRTLNVFLEVSNATNRRNPCCVDFDLLYDDNGVPFVERQEDFWLPLLPAVGFLLEF